jgi:hypothetical protein
MTMELATVKPVLIKAVALAALFSLGGCVSSPTYGTGKTANAQLFEDVSGAFSIKPKPPTGIKYEPRPEVLKSTQVAGLPEPQEPVTKQAGVWPESPEEKRIRLRAEATAGQSDPNFEPTIYDDTVTRGQTAFDPSNPNSADRDARKRVYTDRNAIKEAKKIKAAGSPTNRKHLSEPPLDYRQPTDTAAYGDLGEDEFKKERRLRAEARKKKGKKSFKDYVPWL